MRIRDARRADIPTIAAIWNLFIRDSAATFDSTERTPDTLAQIIRDRRSAGGCFLVAETDGQVCGFACYGPFRGGSGCGSGYRHTFEHTLYVAPKAAGRGAGRALIRAIEDHARRRGGHSIFAGVSAENTDSIAFHRRMGYAEAARLCKVGRKFDRWHDLILMQKFL